MTTASALWRLVYHWWRSDRLRISPLEGQLLNLPTPCFLRLRGQLLEVRERCQPDTGSASVVYYCLNDQGSGRLRVSLEHLDRPPQIMWSGEQDSFAPDVTDIEVFMPKR